MCGCRSNGWIDISGQDRLRSSCDIRRRAVHRKALVPREGYGATDVGEVGLRYGNDRVRVYSRILGHAATLRGEGAAGFPRPGWWLTKAADITALGIVGMCDEVPVAPTALYGLKHP